MPTTVLSVKEARIRIALKKGLLEMADMSMHMRAQKTIVVPKPNPEEYELDEVKALPKHECEAYGVAYPTNAGLNQHQAQRCDMYARQEETDNPVEKVLDSV